MSSDGEGPESPHRQIFDSSFRQLDRVVHRLQLKPTEISGTVL